MMSCTVHSSHSFYTGDGYWPFPSHFSTGILYMTQHVVLLSDQQVWPSGPVITLAPNLYIAKQTLNAEFDWWRSVQRRPTVKSHSEPCFKYFMFLFLVCQKSWNSLELICNAHLSEVWAQLVLLILCAVSVDPCSLFKVLDSELRVCGSNPGLHNIPFVWGWWLGEMKNTRSNVLQVCAC